MNKKKAFSISASAMVLAGMLSACTQSVGSESTTATTAPPSTMAQEQQSQAEEISVKEFELENKEITFLAAWSRNPANGKAKDIAIEMFQTRFGGKVIDMVVGQDERYDRLATLVSTGSSPDFFSAADMDAFPMGAVNNMFQPVDNYIDFDDEWWKDVKNINDKFVFNGSHYVMGLSTEVEVIMLYNKAVMLENGFKDPAEYLVEGNWNWTTCKQMMEQFCDKSEDNYATDGWWVARGFTNSTGVPFIGMEDGKVVNNLNNPLIAEAEQFIADLNKENLAYPVWDNGWVSNPGNVGIGKTLFYPCGIWALMDLNSEYGMKKYADNMEDLGFVPVPKCPSADAYYIPARISGYLLCSGAPNPEGVACLAYCERAGSTSAEGEQIAKDQYFNEYGWTEEMWDMFQLIYDMADENPVFDFMGGVSQDLSSTLDNASKTPYHTGDSWTQTKEQIFNSVQNEVDKANGVL